MTQPRKRLVCVEATPYYHCIGRCVRRAFLCGQDEFSGKDYEHRRQWIVDRLQCLTQIFAIDVCSYALMSNHYHLVLKLNTSRAKAWNDQDVVNHWCRLFSGNEHSRAFCSGEPMTATGEKYIRTMLPVWRERLSNLSWFMRCLNEYIARKANEEDECSGRFWEGRFKSQALLDNAALLSCMAYVDLNPVRARIASTPEESEYTSVQARIQSMLVPNSMASDWLVPMAEKGDKEHNLPINLYHYLALVDWTGRLVTKTKGGAIPIQLKPILARLELDESTWLHSQCHFGKQYYSVIGARCRVRALALRIGQSWLAGQGKQSQCSFG